MNWMELLQEIFQVCIIPLLGVLTAFAVKWIRLQSIKVKEQTNNELLNKYIGLLESTIVDCVIATNQTFVESLKDKNIFDENAQKEAFRQTYDAVMHILTTDVIEYLDIALGDLDLYIKEKIEAEVNLNK